MVAQVGGMPGGNYAKTTEENPNIFFRYVLGENEKSDSDYIETIQKAIDNLREVGGGKVFEVELVSDLLPLHNESEWLLDLDVDNKGVVGLKDANITTYKIQIPINRIREIIINEAK